MLVCQKLDLEFILQPPSFFLFFLNRHRKRGQFITNGPWERASVSQSDVMNHLGRDVRAVHASPFLNEQPFRQFYETFVVRNDVACRKVEFFFFRKDKRLHVTPL